MRTFGILCVALGSLLVALGIAMFAFSHSWTWGIAVLAIVGGLLLFAVPSIVRAFMRWRGRVDQRRRWRAYLAERRAPEA